MQPGQSPDTLAAEADSNALLAKLAKEAIASKMANQGVPAQPPMLMPQNSRNPYAAGLAQDPANMGNKGRIEGNPDDVMRAIMMDQLRNGSPPQQLPQNVIRR